MNSNKNIRLLTVTFNIDISSKEIPNFRGAVIETTKGKNNLFHNHTNEGVIYRYPKIQYKSLFGKAVLICIEEGIEGIQDFFSETDWKLTIGEKKKEIKVENLKVRHHQVAVWDKTFVYTINSWLPLNQDNYKKFHDLEGYAEKIELLEKILLSNIISFLQGIDLFIKEKIEVKIKQVHSEKLLTFKGQQMQSFKLDFGTNISLPDNIGLGKGTSIGFGVIKEKTDVNKSKKPNNVYEQ